MDTPIKCLTNSISRFIHLVSCQNVKLVPIQKDYRTIAGVLKLLKPVLESVVDYEICSDEILCKECEELDVAVNMAREFMEDWSPKMSKICSVSNSFVVNSQPAGKWISTPLPSLVLARGKG